MLQTWNITIPALTGDEERRAWAYVPDGAWADRERRYGVLYMFDGQNLFADADASYGKSWGILDYFTAHNVPLMVAAIECSHHAETDPCGGRLSEYSPFDFEDEYFAKGKITGRGKATMDYFVNEFKPYIDQNFPTLPDREHTMIAGSSMGGLMTLYALCCYNEVFSGGAALSPSLSFNHPAVRDMLKSCTPDRTVLYMDMGEQELRRKNARKRFASAASILTERGVLVESRVVPGGFHSEASWERQIPFFLNTLLYNTDTEE